MTLCDQRAQAQRLVTRSKNGNNQCVSRRKLSEIKLKRTDTTLDLSQLAKRAGKEKEKRKGGEREKVFIPCGAALVLASLMSANQMKQGMSHAMM